MVVAEVPLWVVHSSDSTATASEPRQPRESLQLLDAASSARSPLYSIDVHGTTVATGGGDGKVRLWTTGALFAKHRGAFVAGGAYASSGSSSDSGAESHDGGNGAETDQPTKSAVLVHDITNLVRRKKGDTQPAPVIETNNNNSNSKNTASTKPPPHSKLLCTLSAHTGSSVLCVRFSTNGNFLASAGDDAVVCIYAPDKTTDNHWSRIKLCRGHTLDVVDLAWAPDDSHLVSCSLDKDAPIIVWKLTDLNNTHSITQSNVLVNPYKILGVSPSHTSTVKGVTFDPAGTYLASSGDDPAVCIWRAHDDWGLETKVTEGFLDSLSSQTLFRRLSWATDGTYICCTNATLNKKHVASTISREGWTTNRTAHLVGHKQPVVVSRHLSRLIQVKSSAGGDDPEYATLVALGDKRGFVTIWSTRKSRPLFKLQCSESRCTVTDLAWGYMGTNVILLVTLLDGHATALKFSEQELGTLLSEADQRRVFQLRYGIDDDNGGVGGRRFFVGDHSAPKLIENALQYSLEEDVDNDIANSDQEEAPLAPLEKLNTKQVETKKDGKKRIRPVLMSVVDDSSKKQIINGSSEGVKKKAKTKAETVKDVLEMAAKAASAAEGIQAPSQVPHKEPNGIAPVHHHVTTTPQHRHPQITQSATVAQIPHSTSRVHTVELPMFAASVSAEKMETYTADCSNSTRIPKGSSGQPLLCTTLSITLHGRTMWKDEIIGTSCCAIAAGKSILVVGTTDGTLYIYGNSPTLGWKCGTSFRSHPPLIVGQPIASLELYEGDGSVRMLVVSADGTFYVHTLLPDLRLEFKGSIFPAMTHLLLSVNGQKNRAITGPLPKLARVQITESGRLLMLLSLQGSSVGHEDDASSKSPFRSVTSASSSGPGGSIQAFVYNAAAELWMRVADSRFVLSDFYTILPSAKTPDRLLATIDDAVRGGVTSSSIKPSRRGRDEASVSGMYHPDPCTVTRSHCEDRLACAMVLESAGEFEFWLLRYVRTLVQGGFEDLVRMVIDLLLGSVSIATEKSTCWWLSSAPTVLGLDRHMLVKKVIPEMSKNRAFQRLTNEISLEVEQLWQGNDGEPK